MISMDNINTIRNLREKHDKSINHIRKELNINWRTAKKYADQAQLPQPKISCKTGMMYTEKWGEIVTMWLLEDAKLAKKKRRTRLYLFEALKAEGFPGSYRTVCQFIHDWKANHTEETHEDQGFERLEHPPAEAQLDFGTMEVVHQDHFKEVKTLVMSFPYSNVSFVVTLPAENQECLLEGMKELFRQAGGVPQKIRIDNMSTAVLKRKTKYLPAELTEGFKNFASYYRFETQVCNPRSGNEKGNVENKVGYVRYHFFAETPIMKDFKSFNEKLQKQLELDHQRGHHAKHKKLCDLYAEEKPELLPLPDETYPVFKEVDLKVNKYSEVKLDNTMIHIPHARNHALLHAVLRFDSFKLFNELGQEIFAAPRPYMNKKMPIDWLTIVKDWRYKLSAMTYSRYWKYLPTRIKLYLNHADRKEQARRVDVLLNLLTMQDMLAINENFYQLVEPQESADPYNVDWKPYDGFLSVPAEVVKNE